MRLFRCQSCDQILHFENVRCERCQHRLGFLPEPLLLTALEEEGDAFRALAEAGGGRRWRYCDNAGFEACNWLVDADAPAASGSRLCPSCRHNRTVPDLTVPANLLAWRKIEVAKHRLTYSLLKHRLPVPTADEDAAEPLVFDVLADAAAPNAPRVLTGHDNGLITLALIEADDSERERRRTSMGEPYRTLLGHVRHETGHFYWDLLVRDGGKLDACRAIFGDDTADYGEALQRHYRDGPPPDWQNAYVSSYATAHAWEDFAESWAHYLHIVDTLEMATAFGLSVDARADRSGLLSAEIDVDPYRAPEIGALIELWLPLTHAVNSLNRCMGAPDLYPFVLSPPAIAKLGFIHDLVHPGRA